jgi:hypothetical protein
MRHSAGPTVLLRILVIVFLPLTASPAAGEPVLIDFEMLDAMDFWSGQPIPEAARLSDELATTHGVLFSSGAGYVAVVALGVGHATSGTNGIGGSTPDGILTYDRGWPVVFQFVDPQNPVGPAVTDFVSVRGDLSGTSGQEVIINAYDVSGGLVDSDHVLDFGGETLTVAAAGIHRVEFLGTQDDCGVGLDDLTFNPVIPIPTPTTSRTWGRVKAAHR